MTDESPPFTQEILDRIEAFEAPYNALCEQEWSVGANDRGMGHYSYAVITVGGDMVVKCDHLIIAEHIVKVHNESRSSECESSDGSGVKA